LSLHHRHLQDKDQGEFAYELVGEATLPAPCLEVSGPSYLSTCLPA
jgi:hypothetical protein